MPDNTATSIADRTRQAALAAYAKATVVAALHEQGASGHEIAAFLNQAPLPETWPVWSSDPLIDWTQHEPRTQLDPVTSAAVGQDAWLAVCRCKAMRPTLVRDGAELWEAYVSHMQLVQAETRTAAAAEQAAVTSRST